MQSLKLNSMFHIIDLALKWDERRVKIVDELKSKGINPYPHKYDITHTIIDIKKMERSDKPTDAFAFDISTAGRVANIRRHGKISFVDIFDEGERLQLQLRVNELGDRYDKFFEIVDRGDILGVKGDLLYTIKGELTLRIKDYVLLSKSLIEPPDWSKLASTNINASEDIPPKYPLDPILLMKTFSPNSSSDSLILLPIKEPKLNGLDGSISITPTLCPLFKYSLTSLEISVLFPEPGEPVIPITWAFPEFFINCSKASRPSGVRYSILVNSLPIANWFPLSASSNRLKT